MLVKGLLLSNVNLTSYNIDIFQHDTCSIHDCILHLEDTNKHGYE